MTNHEEVTEIIFRTIDGMPHARRLHPDVYSHEVTESLTEWIEAELAKAWDDAYSVGWNQSDARDFNPENPYKEDTE